MIPNFGASLRPRFLRQAPGLGSGENLSGDAVTCAHRTPKSSSPDDSRNKFSKNGITPRSAGEKVWPAARQGRSWFGGKYLPGSLTHASRPNKPAAKLVNVSRKSGSNGADMIRPPFAA